MKKLFFLIILTPGMLQAYAQTDSVKIEQFCQLIAVPRILSNKVTIDIDFGQEKKFWNDSRLRDREGAVKKFNTIIDAMNFMGREGWSFIHTYPVRNGDTEIFHFAFRKLFYIAKLQ
ncbi:hypothetical protein [Mucilaginibacter sp. UR6-11]|uniref:hypothetical protein n=1 Tax=Mucilaginibacter sp. UR6-11 TaxID=1435644 RepID=UPI001E3A0BEC|nr:hypothetical protein [Mucilaginibacter sp. UR6-11]MCC8423508.1 hypothetical protein [Mucilaginibacter sp. UR6-11]